MNLIHIKLKNGDDLLAQVFDETEKTICIAAPICIKIDPTYGIMGTGWCHLSDTTSVVLNKKEFLFYNPASERGYKYYEEFAHKFIKDDEEEEAELSDLEEMFNDLLESRASTKH